MKLLVDCDEGFLAQHPELALSRLADVAEADGADRGDWLAKALLSAGATQQEVAVLREPAYQIVKDARDKATEVYRLAMKLAVHAVRERLERAARDPVLRDRYRRVHATTRPASGSGSEPVGPLRSSADD